MVLNIPALFYPGHIPVSSSKFLNPGEFLIFRDDQYFHYTTPIQATAAQGVRDVFVLTCLGLFPSDP